MLFHLQEKITILNQSNTKELLLLSRNTMNQVFQEKKSKHSPLYKGEI